MEPETQSEKRSVQINYWARKLFADRAQAIADILINDRKSERPKQAVFTRIPEKETRTVRGET